LEAAPASPIKKIVNFGFSDGICKVSGLTNSGEERLGRAKDWMDNWRAPIINPIFNMRLKYLILQSYIN